ncbi:hypothetical protein Tco_0721521 [Tanacetum coccineum]
MKAVGQGMNEMTKELLGMIRTLDLPMTLPMVLMVTFTAEYNVFAVDTQHSEQPECIINTCVVEKADSNVTPYLPHMCDIQFKKLDIDENKTIQKQLKKAKCIIDSRIERVCKLLLEEIVEPGEST